MAMTEYKIIRNDEQYELYLERFSELFNLDFSNQPNLEDEFDLLALLIKDYEGKNYPIDDLSPVEYIKFIMDQKGLTNKDMEQYLGSLSKVSEVLNGRRNLSLNMIKKLHNGLGIPTDILIKDVNNIESIEYVIPTEVYKITKIFDNFRNYIYRTEKRKNELYMGFLENTVMINEIYKIGDVRMKMDENYISLDLNKDCEEQYKTALFH